MTIHTFEFDHLEHWKSDLSRTLGSIIPSEIADILREAKPEFISDARDIVFDVVGRDPIIDEAISWVGKYTVFALHGTRLNADEFHSVENEGLKILRSSERRGRLERALSRHPRWDSVQGEISSAITRHGPGERLGRREGQVHLTLSRAGLTNGFPHYLNGGSEFDQNVAMDLLGADGVELLEEDGVSYLVKVAIPGREAMNAAHPHFSMEGLRRMGDVPNIIDQVISVWSFELAHPGFDPATQ